MHVRQTNDMLFSSTEKKVSKWYLAVIIKVNDLHKMHFLQSAL